LLDDLAARFIAHGWSLKWLHREIMLSATYQQSSTPDAEKFKADPENRWLGRMSRRRLDVESWRDAMLAAGGDLDLRVGGPPVDLGDAANQRRTLYGSVARRELNDMLRLYDFPQPEFHSPKRDVTTTPLQQLFVLNGPLIQRQSELLVQRIGINEPVASDAELVARCYRLLFARPPTERELLLADEFLGSTNGPARAECWRQYVHVLLGLNEFMFVD
jgi:hypothetical protein